mmetsp:Transcript_25662/g.64503  ORF Transcript_25662/g.64503 Transcript_25662/m.64503 type:complete len:119 (+) Transcript_25662:332-688(+)
MLLFAAKTGQLQPKRVDPYGCGFDAVTKSRFPRTTVFGSLRALSPSYGERWFALATSLLLAFLSLLVLTARSECGQRVEKCGQKCRPSDVSTSYLAYSLWGGTTSLPLTAAMACVCGK